MKRDLCIKSVSFSILLGIFLYGCLSPPGTRDFSSPDSTTKVAVRAQKEQATISAEQISVLASLRLLESTRADIIRTLGEPDWVAQKEPSEASPEETIMSYGLASLQPSGEVRFLMVFLRKGRLYSGYLWSDSASFRGPQDLVKAKNLMEQSTEAAKLLEAFGPPTSIGFRNDKNRPRWSYNFQPPSALAGLEISEITLSWLMDLQHLMRFYGAWRRCSDG